MTEENSPIEASRFCTDDLQVGHRLSFMRDYYGRHLMGVDISPPAGEDFRLSARTLQLPGIVANLGRSSALVFERTPPLMRDGSDDLLLSVMSTPSRLQSDKGGDLDIAGGEAVLCPADQPWRWAHGEVEALSVRVARTALPAGSRRSNGTPVRVPKGAPALRLLMAYVRTLFEIDQPLSAASGHLAARHLQELLAQAVQARPSETTACGDGTGVAAARLALMKRDIERRLDDVALDVGWLASRYSVTPRYVQMLFEQDGTTFSAYVRSRRLNLAYRMLSESGYAHRRIGDIALGAGFPDISNFNRAFRRHYGVTPTEVRAEALRRTQR